MGTDYDQLGLGERIEMYRLHAGGTSQRKIAAALGRSPSTISRELARNSKPSKVWRGGYDAVRAQQLAERRRRWDGRFKLMRQPDLRRLVENGLAMGCSPEQIAGRLTLDHGHSMISHESIYRYIYHRSAQKDYLHRLLPRHKSRRGRRGRGGGSSIKLIKHRLPLTERPVEATDRAQPGHWEADYMLFAKYGQNVLVLHERHTRFTIIDKPLNRKAVLTASRISRKLKPFPKALRLTISFDNGPEFAEHHRLRRARSLGIATFFCDPHSPWQKGGVENTIGRLRRMMPRKTDLRSVSQRKLAAYAHRLNNTPRKCLGFRTPAEAFDEISTVALQT